ncbi:hypothetical protein CDES_05615 [Corynebacterium deserti GIMN1.010]|uniref:Uncharacterized protein n=1 Tax=Corynebacterium deserti GIMN1.010 TaxID=931089 RepID=A0A0M4CXC1_9CORY|nr:hypothetical protein [Corynebacterium deserti]ALC05557.1 hypothetical protein CDES_05615 [Corynebacterium deserti GIMN1.010]
MAITIGSFPHPVLGNQDDVSSLFALQDAHYRSDVDDIEISFRLINEDQDLHRLIDTEAAELKVRWDCPVTMSTGYLEVDVARRHHDGSSYRAWLDQRLVRDDVQIDVFVVAARNLSDFSWSNQHPDYGRDRFEIRKGDVLADGGSFSIRVGKLYDPLNPPIGSCFRVTKEPGLKKGVKIDFSADDQVVILVSEAVAEGLSGLSHRPDLQISLLIFPALMETVSFIQKTQSDESAENLEDKAWFQTVNSLIESLDSDSSPFGIAQELLGNTLIQVFTDPLFPAEELD